MATTLGAVGADPSLGYCTCLRREFSGEPDAGNLHLRFDEGRVGRATRVALSPTLPALYAASFRAATVRSCETLSSRCCMDSPCQPNLVDIPEQPLQQDRAPHGSVKLKSIDRRQTVLAQIYVEELIPARA